MATPLIPQEIYLLERYSSVAYFEQMLDAWAAMVKLSYDALDAFVRKLPPDYRSRPLFNQPDIVWGNRVIPNFQSTLDAMNQSYVEITHGDLRGLKIAGGVSSDFASFRRDYSEDWMDEPAVRDVIPDASDKFGKLLQRAVHFASNIERTTYSLWAKTNLTTGYSHLYQGPLNPPDQWPSYRIDPSVTIRTGEVVVQTGIYLPDASDSCASLLIAGRKAFEADVGLDPSTGNSLDTIATKWTLVRRTADSGGGVPGAENDGSAGLRLRCEAGQPCPREGFWFTPAQAHSRRHFKHGEVMPEVGSSYGVTIWQWDDSQA